MENHQQQDHSRKLASLRLAPQVESAPRFGARWLLIVAPGLVFLLLVNFVWSNASAGGSETSITQSPTTPTAPIATPATQTSRPTEPARATKSRSGLTAAGYLEVTSPGASKIVPKVNGQIEEVLVREGDTVKAGQVLARFDDTPHRLDLEVQESELTLAQARLAQSKAGARKEAIQRVNASLRNAEAHLTYAKAMDARHKNLQDKGVTARSQYEELLRNKEQAEAQVQALQAEVAELEAGPREVDHDIFRSQVAVAEARVKQARWELAQCEIRAPYDGVILDVHVQPGQVIMLDEMGASGGGAFTLYDPQALRAWVDVNQRDLARIEPGMSVELATDAYPGRPVQAVVDRILPRASLQKNTILVWINIPNPPEYFRPDMSIKAQFGAAPIEQAVVNKESSNEQ